MNTDIRIDIKFFSNTKTRKLQKRCGDGAVLSLMRLWARTAMNKPDGNLSCLDDEDIALAAEWVGDPNEFVKNLITTGFIDNGNGRRCIHDWLENQPWAALADERSDKARLSRLARINKQAYEKLRADGRTGVSKTEFVRLTTVERPLTNR